MTKEMRDLYFHPSPDKVLIPNNKKETQLTTYLPIAQTHEHTSTSTGTLYSAHHFLKGKKVNRSYMLNYIKYKTTRCNTTPTGATNIITNPIDALS